MTDHCTPYCAVPHSTSLLIDYVHHHDRVGKLYNGSPHELRSFQAVASQLANFTFDRAGICAILERQNRAFGCAQPTLESIDRLRRPGTFAVVTGQQVGLLSGPAFTLYKALTTVRVAHSLTEQGIPSVPIFWLATEDHDLEEVSHANTFDDEYNLLSLHDTGNSPSPRAPVGSVRHTDEITNALNQLEAALPAGESRLAVLNDLRECYVPGATWGESFGRFLTRLFGRWGVILLDPLDDAIHRLSASVYRQAMEKAPELRTGLLQSSQGLVKQGYHAQVHVADDSTLLFLNRNGQRLPLDQRDGKFLIDGKDEITLSELQSGLTERPLDFSANVLLRPLVQDTLLPTLTYVAGPSELAYHGQMQTLYQAFKRPQPVIFPRAGFTLIDARTERLMEKYKVEITDVWQGEDVLGQKIVAAGFAQGWSENFDQSEREMDQLLTRLQADIEKLDPTLLDTLQHTKEKMKYQMERLRGKLTRAALSRSDLLTRHVQALSRFLMPQKDLQERRVSGVYFLGRAGYELLEHLLAKIQIHCSDHQAVKF